MLEVKDGICPGDIICDKCLNRRRYMVSEAGQIYGVFCIAHNDVVSPFPDVCSEYESHSHVIAKEQRTLKLEY